LENFWDREVAAPTHTSWMEDPLVRNYILRSIAGGESGLWPMDWFDKWLNGRRFQRALSIGCGTGALERDLVRRGLVRRVDAFDGSTNSLRIAREYAAAEGLSARIHYFAYDFNRGIPAREKYDAVFIHQALHHVENLEILLRAVMMRLRGILYLDEYVGPSRTEWSDGLDRQVEMIDAALGRRNASPDAMRRLIDEEQKRLAAGENSYYAVIVARPKRGVAKWLAWWRYRKAIRRRLGLRP
jgi:SAM-dependent methyltransferase